MSFPDWAFKIIVPTLPFSERLVELWFRTKDGNSRLERLQAHSNKLLAEAMAKKSSATKLETSARQFQDELYDFRSKEIPVFDNLYWKFWDQDEAAMNDSADSLVAKFKKDSDTP